jgi:hypothetical protein
MHARCRRLKRRCERVEKANVVTDVVIGVAAWLAVVVGVFSLCRRAAEGDEAIAAVHRELRAGGDPDSPALAGEEPRRPGGAVSELRWMRRARFRTR